MISGKGAPKEPRAVKRRAGGTPKRAQKQAFTCPVYGGLIIVHRSPGPAEKSLGSCERVDLPSGRVRYELGWYDRSAATLVHECVHLALFILQRAGVRPTSSGGEPLAYLTDWLFTKIKSL